MRKYRGYYLRGPTHLLDAVHSAMPFYYINNLVMGGSYNAVDWMEDEEEKKKPQTGHNNVGRKPTRWKDNFIKEPG